MEEEKQEEATDPPITLAITIPPIELDKPAADEEVKNESQTPTELKLSIGHFVTRKHKRKRFG